ncbi:MAG: pyridoxal phosphate-dependent aminotransferase, partial [Leptospiraceae bacterium]|nr:pyridoxal phosphate-dependent aminotransferase [Leptospiraceae bacterium]
MIPREFFIEDRLEKYRLEAECNLGESGFRNFTLGYVCDFLGISFDDLKSISLADSPNKGREDLRKEIASLYEGITSEEVLVTTGTSEALFLFFSLVLSKDDVVRYLSPAFQALYEIPLTLSASLDAVPISGNEIFVEELFKSYAKLVIINHPH